MRRMLRSIALLVPFALVTACGSAANPEALDSNTPGSASDTTPGSAEPGATQPDGTGPRETAPATAGTIDWEEYSDGVETGTLVVPIDYSDPSKGTFELFLARHLATGPDERIGSLLVNPGGPGFGGSDYALYADGVYGESLLERFDIIGWDPRGTGLSEPAIDCIEDYDRYFATNDITPDDDEEQQQIVDRAKEFSELCVENNGDFLLHVGTNNSARDMDSIRRALGEDEISYFGFSYGSELGATWATLFPDTVRAAVLDGASDPNADPLDSSLQQVRGFERSVATFLAQCSDDDDCAFHNGGDAERAFDELMLRLDEDPIPTEPGRADATRQVALQAVAKAMYSDALWDDLEEALAAAQDGDGSGLLALYDQYYARNADGTYDNSLEAFQTISCMDTAERQTVEEEDAQAELFNEAAPRFAPHTTGGYFCTFYPPAPDPRVEITGEGAGPILVVGTTGDPATPLESTESMADALEAGVLLVVEADQHTGYHVNDCSRSTVEDYLVDLELPDDGFVCD